MSIKFLVLAISFQTVLRVTTLIIPQTDFYTRETEGILRRHNIYRQCHNAPPLELDDQLSRKAQQCAANSAVNHSQPAGNGTNIFSYYSSIHIDSVSMRSNTDLQGVNVVDQWYLEQLKYPKSIPSNFSQLVWKSSRKLGVGIVQSDDGEIFVCCTYDPVGNIRGSYENNVVYSTNLSDSDIEKCLQSASENLAENAAAFKNIVRPPIFLLLANETGDDDAEATTSNGDSAETNGSTTPEQTEDSNSTANSVGRNCTGPNCTRSNDTRPLMSALKRELQMAVAENSKKTNDLIKIAIVILIVITILVVVILIVSIVALAKVIKMMSEEECCESGNDTPSDDPRFAKSLAASASVAQSMQSYM